MAVARLKERGTTIDECLWMKCAKGGHDNAASAQFFSQCGSTLDFPCPDRAALAAHLGALHNRPFAFAQITAPTLVIAGEDDTLSPEPEKLAEALPRGQAVMSRATTPEPRPQRPSSTQSPPSSTSSDHTVTVHGTGWLASKPALVRSHGPAGSIGGSGDWTSRLRTPNRWNH